MNIIINCEQCGKSFSQKRKDARFCSNTCRSALWKQKQEQSLKDSTFHAQLKGVVSDSQQPKKQKEIKCILNPKYTAIENKLKTEYAGLNELKKNKAMLQKQLQNIRNPLNDNIEYAGASLGAYYSIVKSEEFNFLDILIKSSAGFLGAKFLKEMSKESEENIASKTKTLQEAIRRVETFIIAKEEIIMNLRTELALIPKNLEVEIDKVMPSTTKFSFIQLNNGVCNPNLKEEKTSLNVSENVSEQKLKRNNTFENVNHSDKIVSSAKLTSMNYQALDFQHKWRDFFGYPSVNFHCVLHGMSGEGKSTFALQFAHYLAENFGLVLYISGEEGFAKTMKDKIVNNQAMSDNLLIADIRSYEELQSIVEPNTYNFIFIDSLDNMRIGATEMKEIRKVHQKSALITISQSTKDGKMRGSYEIVHDSDIAVEVSKGIGETIKNRFAEKGKRFIIFKRESKAEFLPRNMREG